LRQTHTHTHTHTHCKLYNSDSLIRGDCLEWTSLWFSNTPVILNDRLDKSFERYLYGPGAYSVNIRRVVAHIASQLPENCGNVIREVLRIILNSFKSMNATVRLNGHKGGPPRHLLLKIGAGGKKPNVAKRRLELSPPTRSHVVSQSLILSHTSHVTTT